MKATKKITIALCEDLLTRATMATGKGITPTVRAGLEAMAASGAHKGLRRLRGKVKLSVDVDALRRD